MKNNHKKADNFPNSEPILRFSEFSEEWEVKKLGEVAEIYDGTHQTPKYVEEGIPFYSVEHITSNNFEKTKYISEKVFEKEYKRVKIEKGDILMTRIGDIGTSKYIDWNVKASFYVSVALIKSLEKINSRYLNQYISSLFFQKELWKRTIHVAFPKKINLGEIGLCEIYYPAFFEQTKIANFLSKLDEKIQTQRETIEELEKLIKGYRQKLFSQELRFKDDKGKEFPDWKEKTLGKICDYRNGSSFESLIVENGSYNLITLNSINIKGQLKKNHKKVPKTDNSLKKNDLVMVLSDVAHGNFLGLVDIIPDNSYVLNQRMGALKPKTEINIYYLKSLINFNQKYFKLMGQGSSQQNLSKGDILKFIVKYPCIEEQNKIANFLSKLDDKLTTEKNLLTTLEEQKKFFLQNMFV